MKHEALFTFGEDDEYELIEASCVVCHCDVMFIEETRAISLPICLVCERGIEQAVEDVDRKLDTNEEG